jgi:hypothetical protein
MQGKNPLFFDFFKKNVPFFGLKTAIFQKYVVTTIDLIPAKNVKSKVAL